MSNPADPPNAALIGVTAVAPNNVWAVGWYYPPGHNGLSATLVEHWNGSAWSVVPSFDTAFAAGQLAAVVALSATDVWAVGFDTAFGYTEQQPLIGHWDGTGWREVPSPVLYREQLQGVAFTGPTDGWAVGNTTGSYLLTEHWDGASWTIVPGPAPGPSAAYLQAVAAPAPDNIWAVGYGIGRPNETIILHWDGQAWSQSRSVDPGAGTNELYAVAAAGPDDLWAAGITGPFPGIGYQPLLEQAQGTCAPPSPTPTVKGTPPTATPTACRAPDPLTNGGFETGDLTGWPVLAGTPAPQVTTALPHTGQYAALLGTTAGPEPAGDSAIYQAIAVPPQGGALSFWWYGGTFDTIEYDWQDAYITDLNGTILATILHTCTNTPGWVNVTFDLAPYAGQTIRLEFLDHEDGYTDRTYMYIDDVSVQAPCPPATSTATPTPRPTTTPGEPSATAGPFGTTPTPSPPPPAPPTSTPPGLTTTTPLPTATPGGPPTTPPAGTPSAAPVTPLATAPGGPSRTPTPCPASFTDVQPTDYFYAPVQYLACRGVFSGYGDGTFRPYANTTRAQLVKIVVLGFATPIQTPSDGTATFADVPPAHPFAAVIETASAWHLVSGYTCGGPGEPCTPPANRPYFRPAAAVTRGQLAKIAVVAAGWPVQYPATGAFADVGANTAFYPFVETAACQGILSGYTCGAPGEPCDAQRRPYFRPARTATRGQIARIVYGALTSTPTCGGSGR